MTSSHISQRLRRLSASSLIVAALASEALSFGSVQSAGASTAHAAPGTFSCPGNTMVVHIPTMTSLTGITENASWWPVLQRWTVNGWAMYSQYGYFQGSTDFGGSHFAYKNG